MGGNLQEEMEKTSIDVENFNAQYPILEVKYTKVFQNRFLNSWKRNGPGFMLLLNKLSAFNNDAP